MSRTAWPRLYASILAAIIFSLCGCTSPGDYIKNGFKVGPNPCVPQGNTAAHWIDDADVRVQRENTDINRWWTVFQDPNLDQLIVCASRQNLSLREACFRVLEARAQLGIARGEILPQQQYAGGGYQRWAASQNAGTAPGYSSQFFDQWNFGFNLSWELDFWGRLRRAITAAEDTMDASSANYDDVLVTLLGDVATNYVEVRTVQDRIRLAQENVKLQQEIVRTAERRFKVGSVRAHAVDAPQARSNLAQTESHIPQLYAELRQACNRLCVLLGLPPAELEKQWGLGPIPSAPATVAVGIPADLLRRRPDVRRAERQAFAQGQRIGIAEAELYPAFFINGTLGYSAENLPQLFTSDSLTAVVGPAFQWNILNYNRIRNNIHVQDARFQALVATYQNTVLRANAEAEDGLVVFLRAQERAQALDKAVANAKEAVDIGFKELGAGKIDYNQVALIEQNKVQQEDLQALAHGEIAQGLIRVYRALGGGWQADPALVTDAAPAAPLPPNEVPAAPLPATTKPAEEDSSSPPKTTNLLTEAAPMPPQLR